MSITHRRAFLVSVVASGAALAATRVAAQTPGPKLAESDPQAVALGYKEDGSKVDAAKYPAHTAAQACGNCNFFQGKPADAMAPCQLFASKQVNAKGWCSGYSKKA